MRSVSTWSLHITAGFILFILLSIHMITMHLDLILGWFNLDRALPGIDWTNVSARGRNIVTAVFYVVFLGVALFHGLYGLRTIIFELGVSLKVQRIITAVFVMAWMGLFLFGSAAAYQFYFNVVG